MTTIELGQFYPIETDALPETWSVAYVGDFAWVVQSGFDAESTVETKASLIYAL